MKRPRPGAAVRLVVLVVTSLAVSLPLGSADESMTEPRKPPRPERTAAERATAAQLLREVYRSDPARWPAPTVDPGVAWREIGLLPEVVHPESNPLNTPKVTLGRTLFFDARLSGSGKMACVSCHEPNLGWADGRAVSQPQVKSPARNTPTIRNAVFQTALFWDGRADSLEQQVEEALTNPAEMAARPNEVVGMLAGSAGYRTLFAEAFPGRPAFSDGRFHDLGLSFYGRSLEDRGRYAVTKEPGDNGRFRTPTLRDVTRTTPLMHTGKFELDGVLNMYNAGMVTLKRHGFQREDPLFPVKSPHLKPLGLNPQDLADLAAFLGTLEEPKSRERQPKLPAIDAAAVMAAP
jgi:cytochrome c peroxidase